MARDDFLVHVYGDALMYYKQMWLGFLFATMPSTALSGVTMGFIFLHAIAEGSLCVMRLASVLRRRDSYVVVPLLATYWTLSAIVIILTDNPVVKALITAVPAFSSDISNLVLTVMMILRSRKEGSLSPKSFDVGHLVFEYTHIVVFYTPILTVCFVDYWVTALIILLTMSINLVFLALYLTTNLRSLFRECACAGPRDAIDEPRTVFPKVHPESPNTVTIVGATMSADVAASCAVLTTDGAL